MWQGDCLHWAIARFLGTIRNTYSLAGEDVLAELREKMEREWMFSEQKRFWDQPTQIDKGGLALVEHEYSSVPSGTTLDSIFKSVAAATSLFVIWAESPGGIVAKIKVADNVWIEPPVFGDGAPGFVLDDVQIIAKVDLAIEKRGDFFEIYDWKIGEPRRQNGTCIDQYELQVSVYQLWPHLAMRKPLEMITSHLVYFGNGIPEVCTHRLDEKAVPLILSAIRNSVALASRLEKHIQNGEMRLEDLDYAGSVFFCRECPFKGVCSESL